MVRAQASLELRLLLRNGEQVLLTVVIPVLMLLGLTLTRVVDVGGGRRVDVVVPGVLALALMSTAFTGQAIATGFERRYGVLKRLGATPLPRGGLLAGKTAAVAALEAGQIVVVALTALVLGWRASGSALAVAAFTVAGTAAFSGLALLMAGTLRAETTLAAANLAYLVQVALGGVVVPFDRYPPALRTPLELLPLGALSDGLRAALTSPGSWHWRSLLVLVLWALASQAAAARTFRWT